MARYSATFRDQNEAPIPGALVSVAHSDGTSITLTEDDGNPLLNPITTDQYGGWYFNTPSAAYCDFSYIYGGRTVLQERQVPVGFDPATYIANSGILAPIAGAIAAVAADTTNINAVAGDLANVNTLAGISAALTALAADLTNLNLVAADLTNLNNVAGDLTNLNAVAGDLANVDAVSAAITSINAVQAALANIAAVAGDLSNINSVSGNLTVINAVQAALTAINAVYGSLANVNSVATNMAAITAVQAALTSLNGIYSNLSALLTVPTAAATVGVYGNAAASNVPRGLTQASVGAITAGSGGTNGTYTDGTWTGGNFTINPTFTYTIAGNVLTAFTVTGPGLYIGASPTVPTPVFGHGLTGASVALTAQFLQSSGNGFWVNPIGSYLLQRRVNSSGTSIADPTGVGDIATAQLTVAANSDQLVQSAIANIANSDPNTAGLNWARRAIPNANGGASNLVNMTYSATTDSWSNTTTAAASFQLDLANGDSTSPFFPADNGRTKYFAVLVTGDFANMTVKLRRQNAAAADIVTLTQIAPGLFYGSTSTIPTGTLVCSLVFTYSGTGSVTISRPNAGINYPVIDPVATKFSVYNRPVYQPDYTFVPTGPRSLKAIGEAMATLFADSVAGSDSAAGTAPTTSKQSFNGGTTTLNSLVVAGSRIALAEGSSFNDYLNLVTSSSPGGDLDRIAVMRRTKAFRDSLPLFDCTIEPPAGSWVDNGNGSFTYTFVGYNCANNGYNDLGAFIALSANVAAKPMTAWRRMQEGSGANSGLYTTTPTTSSNLSGPTTGITYSVTIWPPDGLAPGSSPYRYRVTNQPTGLYWFNATSTSSGWASDLDFFGPCWGYGSIGAQGYLLGENMVFRHGTTHHMVNGGCDLQNLLTWDIGDADAITFTNYRDDVPAGATWAYRNVLSFGTTGRQLHYSHSGNGSTWTRGRIRRWTSYDPVPVTTPLINLPTFASNNCLDTKWDECYVNDGNAIAFQGAPNTRTVNKAIIIDKAVAFDQSGNGLHTVSNNFARLRSWGGPSASLRGCVFVRSAAVLTGGNSLDVLNNTVHLRATSGALANDSNVSLYGQGRPNKSKYNIFVIEALPGVDPSITLFKVDEANPNDWESDYNIYVLCGAAPAGVVGTSYALVQHNSAPTWVWQNYLSNTGQDSHSLFINLLGNPLGARAIWNDPDSFDYTLRRDSIYAQMVGEHMRKYGTGASFTLNGLPIVPDPDHQYIAMRTH